MEVIICEDGDYKGRENGRSGSILKELGQK